MTQPFTATANPSTLLTSEQAGECLHVHPRTLANWRYLGRGPRYVRSGARRGTDWAISNGGSTRTPSSTGPQNARHGPADSGRARQQPDRRSRQGRPSSGMAAPVHGNALAGRPGRECEDAMEVKVSISPRETPKAHAAALTATIRELFEARLLRAAERDPEQHRGGGDR